MTNEPNAPNAPNAPNVPNVPNAPIEPIAQELSGIFIIDLKDLRLSQSQLMSINTTLQETVQTELAKLDDAEGFVGSRLGGPVAGWIMA